jgi:hypothetical protein
LDQLCYILQKEGMKTLIKIEDEGKGKDVLVKKFKEYSIKDQVGSLFVFPTYSNWVFFLDKFFP